MTMDTQRALPIAFDVLGAGLGPANGRYELLLKAQNTPLPFDRRWLGQGWDEDTTWAHPHFWQNGHGCVLWCHTHGPHAGWGISYQGHHRYFGGGNARLPTVLPRTRHGMATDPLPVLSPVYPDYWQMVRDHVRLRGIFFYWMDRTQHLMEPGGARQQADLTDFKRDARCFSLEGA